ncbi:uncharacterized protein LOC100905395 isoform X2 [Galendromus occidentalis]|nr:uncharacterized protein LOC100905395 isoform X2 [Galendromus occidentalis]
MPESMNMLTDGPAIPQQIEPLTTWCSDPKVVFGIAGAFLVVMLVLCIIYEKLKFRRRTSKFPAGNPCRAGNDRNFVSESDSWIYTFVKTIDGPFETPRATIESLEERTPSPEESGGKEKRADAPEPT